MSERQDGINLTPPIGTPDYAVRVYDGLRRLCEQDGIHDVEHVIAQVMHGALTMLYLWDDGNWDGFILCNQTEESPGSYGLNIFGVHVRQEAFRRRRDAFEYHLNRLEEDLRKSGVDRITCYSSKPSISRRIARVGFEPRLTEYVKELKPDENSELST